MFLLLAYYPTVPCSEQVSLLVYASLKFLVTDEAVMFTGFSAVILIALVTDLRSVEGRGMLAIRAATVEIDMLTEDGFRKRSVEVLWLPILRLSNDAGIK